MIKPQRHKVEAILNWCKAQFGRSRLKYNYPSIILYKKYKGKYGDNTLRCAIYNSTTNKILVFLKNHNSYIELCNTIIHEYNHYLLSIREYNKLQSNLISKHKSEDIAYEKHPHEKKCNKAANKLANKCFNDLKHILYKYN